MTLHIVSNPASGSKSADRLLEGKILPLLSNFPSIIVHRTKARADGIRCGQEIRANVDSQKDPTLGQSNVIILGGDGTTHEVLNGFYKKELDSSSSFNPQGFAGPPQLNLIIVPTGTANAFYAAIFPPGPSDSPAGAEAEDQWRLNSLRSFLSAKGQTESAPSSLKPLTLSLSKTHATRFAHLEDVETGQVSTLTHLISSHALHAAILYDSDSPELRKEYPGVERFKVAAMKNFNRWVQGSLKINPSSNGSVRKYDPHSRAFVPLQQDQTVLKGPFIYLACLSTDRLEPNFIPAPFSSTFSPTPEENLRRLPEELDLVVIRPLRDPKVAKRLKEVRYEESGGGVDDDEDWNQDLFKEIRESFSQQSLMKITAAMYDGGKHVDLQYEAEDGKELGETMVEYYRGSGYEWTPTWIARILSGV
ncbi:hypothetical protein IE53DRAFT_361843 [Violaceomyces palustris]|uniref:Uncharacterized protein n=1 Tax=Violaceomyces palustris TaxID=1673888 RepID=A0ACD0NZ96_9BASI|nr:hypothetical protein IE53DRAFT_361843 [Violaceomyces palustris]